ncbi:hypothetical protein AB9P05_03475 [Roseivirga sp. BDSF3-8]|uniref:hypothetical protein n=1 Tax=Roseivirga sp. BDSF3-8 TaxID=3241598 RepID=UPI003531B9DB
MKDLFYTQKFRLRFDERDHVITEIDYDKIRTELDDKYEIVDISQPIISHDGDYLKVTFRIAKKEMSHIYDEVMSPVI